MEAGLHPATGGTGLAACSGDMLPEALVACAGVTMQAIATALGITLHARTVTAEGDLDFRGTLGIATQRYAYIFCKHTSNLGHERSMLYQPELIC